MTYVKEIWTARYFWIHLSKSELRSRFRYSRLGIMWALLQPLLMTGILTLVFGTLLGTDLLKFAPFIFSGIIMWDYFTSCVMGGSFCLIGAEPYIRQRKLPLAIYPLRMVLTSFVLFFLAFCGLLAWSLVAKPANIALPLISLLLTFPLLLILGWPIAIICSFFHTKFRDFQQVMVLVMQALYYVSAVFINEETYKNKGIGFLMDYSPIVHILRLIRAPLLDGQFPSLIDYGYALGAIAVLYAFAAFKIWREEKTLIFYF